MSIKVLIVEDESLAAQKLMRQLGDIIPPIEVAGWVPSVREATAFLQQQAVDLIFLDIQLQDGLSFQLFEKIDLATPVIFTTAYDEYAIQAFRVNSIDYLLKPFTLVDVQQAVDKFQRFHQTAAPRPDYQALARLLAQQAPPAWRERFMVTVGERIQSVPVAETAYLFAAQKYVFLVRKDGSQHIVDFTLDDLEQQLNPADFFRINRKYLIQRAAIQDMVQWTKGRVKITLAPNPGEDTIVSVGRSADFRKWLGR
ncbi:MAG: DNA-binding response regulator [Bacteroidetes bacterium]|nr:MAG: DNA-binding response regulator [Bacteroidota bacterium]